MFVATIEPINQVADITTYRANDAGRLASFIIYNYFGSFSEPISTVEKIIKACMMVAVNQEHVVEFNMSGFHVQIESKEGWLTEEEDSTND